MYFGLLAAYSDLYPGCNFVFFSKACLVDIPPPVYVGCCSFLAIMKMMNSAQWDVTEGVKAI